MLSNRVSRFENLLASNIWKKLDGKVQISKQKTQSKINFFTFSVGKPTKEADYSKAAH
jgi:hypothetical protein